MSHTTITDRPVVITICGSMRFYAQILDTAARLTDKGVIVLAPFCAVEPDRQTSAMTARLDQLHRRKIDMSDQIVVVTDQTLYLGESTRSEIGYAMGQGKPINWSYFRSEAAVRQVISLICTHSSNSPEGVNHHVR